MIIKIDLVPKHQLCHSTLKISHEKVMSGNAGNCTIAATQQCALILTFQLGWYQYRVDI